MPSPPELLNLLLEVQPVFSSSAADAASRRAPVASGIGETLDLILTATEGRDEISIHDVLETFGDRAFGPLILAPALFLTLPTGVVPGVPLLMGAVIATIAIQQLLCFTHPELPRALERLRFKRSALVSMRRKTARLVDGVDALVRPRFTFMLRSPLRQAIAVVILALCVALVPLEFIPFATALPGSALVLLGIAVSFRDGLAAFIGLAAAGGAGVGGWLLLT